MLALGSADAGLGFLAWVGSAICGGCVGVEAGPAFGLKAFDDEN